MNGVEELGRRADHPLPEALEVQVRAAAEQKEKIVAAFVSKIGGKVPSRGFLVVVEAAEHAEDLEERDGAGGAVGLRGGERGNEGEGVVAGGEENGGERGGRNAFFVAFEDALEGADLGERLGSLVARELHVDCVDVRWLR